MENILFVEVEENEVKTGRVASPFDTPYFDCTSESGEVYRITGYLVFDEDEDSFYFDCEKIELQDDNDDFNELSLEEYEEECIESICCFAQDKFDFQDYTINI